jgi:deazaflavin-dependent oxidoreductase (nitroreductase family)
VTYFFDGDDIVLTATNLGNERDPGWCRNLESNPEATIVIAGERVDVRARRTTGEDRRQLWNRWLELQPVARRFERIARREIPVFRLTPIG